MFDIVTTEPEDEAVIMSINSIIKGQTVLVPSPQGNFRVFVPGDISVHGNGGTNSRVVLVVGHGSINSLSGYRTWRDYQEDVSNKIDWSSADTIYIVSCSTAGEGQNRFAFGNIANEIKGAFPKKTVWASKSAVNAKTGKGDWVKLA